MSSQLSLFSDEEMHQPPRNQRQAFLYYMSKLDIEMIELILDDHKTYQDVSKTIFIERLQNVLDNFISNGDTHLKLLNGECNNCYKSCKGYSFIGNTSANHLDLIIVGSSTEIFDIYDCTDFSLNEEDIELSKKYKIEIYADEAINFVPSIEYIDSMCIVEEALEELQHLLEFSIDFNKINEWLEKYRLLTFDLLHYQNQSYKFDSFSDIFNTLDYTYSSYKIRDRIKNAMQIYRKTIANRVDEKRLIQWLLGFEDLYLENLYKHLDVFGDEYEDDYVYFDKQKNYRIAKSNFQEQIEFYNIFCNKYDKMTNKYENTKNISKFYENDEEYKSSILRFYLEESDYFK
jgi:hypothetical protein